MAAQHSNISLTQKKEDRAEGLFSETSAEKATRLAQWAKILERQAKILNVVGDNASFKKQAIELECEMIEEIQRQEIEAKILSKFQNVAFFRCSMEESQGKLALISWTLGEQGIDINSENGDRKRLLDYALEAGNFFIALELMLLGARRRQIFDELNAQDQSFLEYVLDTKPKNAGLVFSINGKISRKTWKKIIELGKSFNNKRSNDQSQEMNGINKYIYEWKAARALIEKNEEELNRIKKNKREKLFSEIQSCLQKCRANTTALNSSKPDFIQKIKKMHGEIEDQDLAAKVVDETIKKFTEYVDREIKFLTDTYSYISNTIGKASFDEAPQGADNLLFVKIICSLELLQVSIDRMERYKKNVSRDSWSLQYVALLDKFLMPSFLISKKMLSHMKKLAKPFVGDFHQDILEFCKKTATGDTIFSELTCKEYISFLKREFDSRVSRFKIDFQEKCLHLPLIHEVLDFFDMQFMSDKKIMFGLCNEAMNNYNCPEDYTYVYMRPFTFLHATKVDFDRIFQIRQASANIFLSLAQEGTAEQQQALIKAFCQDQKIQGSEIESVLAADRKKTKEIQHESREKNRLMLESYDSKRKEEDAKREEERLKEKAKKEGCATLMVGIHQLSKPELALLIEFLTPGKHPNIKNEQVLSLFGPNPQNAKIPPFSFKPTTSGYQLYFKEIAIESFDRQHGKAMSEKFFNNLRTKFKEFDITSNYLEEFFANNANAKAMN